MILTNAPTLEGNNLILRGPQTRDIEPVISILQDETRAKGFGHIPKRGDTWHWLAAMVKYCHIHGYSIFTIETKSGESAGITGICCPETWPKPEVGYVVFRGFEGQSIAYEAASRARWWAYEDLGLTTLNSNIASDNTGSQRLAEQMGACYEKTDKNTYKNKDMMLYRHPGPEALL